MNLSCFRAVITFNVCKSFLLRVFALFKNLQKKNKKIMCFYYVSYAKRLKVLKTDNSV